MTSIAKIYTDSVYENLNPLFANWEPSQKVQLGDYGELRDHTFIYLGNIDKFRIKPKERVHEVSDQKTFASSGSTEVKFHAKGTIPVAGVVNAKASVEINFSKENSVFFNAANCSYSVIADKVALGDAIMNLYEASQWGRSWVVVTDLVKSGATTIAISGGASGSLVLEATGKVDYIDLADASTGLTVKSSTNLGYQVVAQKGLTPLIGLCKIQPKYLWFGAEFQPLALRIADRRLLMALADSPEVKTEESDKGLFFGQLW